MNAVEAKEYGLVDEVIGDVTDIVVVDKRGDIRLATGGLLEDQRSDTKVIETSSKNGATA